MSYPDDLRDQVDEYLRQLRFSDGPATEGLEEAMLYSLLAGGKRIRPVLALATAAALGDDPESVMPLAGALEMVHSYSLIHDDLPAMDDDDLRRGKPSCHVAFGEDVAILAGDALYAEAFKLILSEQRGDPRRLLKASAELASATGVNGMVGGQYLDVEGAAADGADGLRELHARKTGRLIGASVECVCLLHGVDDADAAWPTARSPLSLACSSKSSMTSLTSLVRTKRSANHPAATSGRGSEPTSASLASHRLELWQMPRTSRRALRWPSPHRKAPTSSSESQTSSRRARARPTPAQRRSSFLRSSSRNTKGANVRFHSSV